MPRRPVVKGDGGDVPQTPGDIQEKPDAAGSPSDHAPIDASESIEDQIITVTLRPTRFDRYVGQHDVVENLKISIEAAKRRGEPLDHILLHGPPGLGKTTLANIIAREMEATFRQASGPTLDRPGDLVGILTNLERGDVLFIDEVHRLSRVVEEFLYPAMEDFAIDFMVDKGAYAKTIKINLKHFTLVGATTRPGMLTAPLRERFGIVHRLDFYSVDDLTTIVRHSANVLGVRIQDGGAQEIAKRARGTPRIANRLLRRVRDFAEVRSHGNIDEDVAKAALELERIDLLGLDPLDRSYLRVLVEQYVGGPVGVAALAASLNEDEGTLVDVVEPYLIQIGFLQRTAGGRRATNKAKHYLGAPSASEHPRLL
ncbi:MAG: Holliday junction branch migration DNA helicase RuvB [Candidatus Eremiobacteraeota bacterium]|nr:Holliday junction branch migration DNA helicase RuvB [Candidatus Eremiobacteraeota bacterium]MBV8340031.1 Holliday junction branch migration DNA helicase RuvB [Candidatus Eremiobacteraeota bacterium]MBV8461317.1 Holliday junction branch migration DNA helicase RuvB [Candidatus Eremiobacteraeota bacterium]